MGRIYKMAAVMLCALLALTLCGCDAQAWLSQFSAAAEPTPEPTAAPTPEPTPEDTRIVVAIDPGHGGTNPNNGYDDYGAEADGLRESDLTMQTALALKALLDADERFAPVLTADGTAYLKGSQRGAAAKAAGAQLLLSIHFNSDPGGTASGFECYPAPPLLATNAESLRFAALLTEGFSAAGLELRGENGIRYLYYDENDEKQVVEASDTTAYTDPTFTVLEDCGCPAVLAEQCFLTNAADAALFATADGCQRAAEIYYQAICTYFEAQAEQTE